MDNEQLKSIYLAAKDEINKKITDNAELMRAQVDFISIIVTRSIFGFNLLETRLDDIIYEEYILRNIRNAETDVKISSPRHFKEEVLRGGFIDFSQKVKIVGQILSRRKISFDKKVFLDLAGLRNQIAHGVQNFDSDGEIGIEICLYGRKMEKIDFQELGERFNEVMEKAVSELDNAYRALGMFVVNDVEDTQTIKEKK